MRIIGRLKDGVSLEAARADMAGISERLFPLWQSSFQDRSVRFVPYELRETILAQAGDTLRLLVLAVGLVLLIAVANVASLALVRATARAREISLRTALGASRGRVGRLLITEGILVAGAGAAAGLLLAFALIRGVAVFGLAVPRLSEAAIDLRAFGFAALLALVVGVMVAIHPVLSLRQTGARSALQGGGRDVGARRSTHTARGVLVAAQFGLALPVLAAAALLLNSFIRLGRVDPGFDPSRLLYVGISLPRTTYGDSGAASVFWTRALNRVWEVPTVEAAGLNQSLPPEEPPDVNNFVLVDGALDPGASQPVSPWSVVSASFFETASVPLLEGRMFSASDTGAAPVLIVSRTWARMYSPGRPAIGRQVQGGGCTTCVPYTVIGVVEDVKYLGLAGTAEAVYEPMTQQPSGDLFLMVRTAGPPGQSLEAVREAIRSIDPGLALDDAGTMPDRLALSLAPERHRTALIAGFGVAALLLAAVGVFGMLSYLVTTRRREIGVRMALGARKGEVQQLIVRRGMRWAASGAALGVVAALLTGKWLAASLYEVTPSDPATLVGVTVLLLLVAVAASWLPARRAASVAPMEAIRED
jgi:predicted permease